MKELGWLLLLPVSISLHLLGFRQLLIRIEHVGHLAAEFDTYEKAKRLGLLPRFFYFVTAPKHHVSNAHLLTYWSSSAYIISNSFFCTFLSLLTRRFFMRYDVSSYISSYFGAQEIYRVNQLWNERPPILKLSTEDEDWGVRALEQLGIAKDQWYVCVHAREGGFWPQNELIQSHRNTSIMNMLPAIQEIIRKGGIVVRVGDPSMTPLPQMPSVIDYAHHLSKSQRLDVVLCAKATFFLGCTSGVAFVSMVFGVPVVQTNMIPVSALAVGKCHLSIPKRLWSDTKNSYLGLTDILTSPVGDYYFSHQYRKDNIRVEENTPEDILDVTCEMLNRLEPDFKKNQEDEELHIKYMSLLKPEHYSYGAISRVGIAFLKKYWTSSV